MANLSGQRTFEQMYQEVEQNILEQTVLSTSTYPTLATVKNILNKHYKIFVGKYKWEWAKKSTTLATVNGTTQITMPDDVAEVYQMQIRANSVDLKYMPREEFLKQFPAGWTNVGNSIPALYIPAAPASNNALQFDLWPTPNAIFTINYDYRARFTPMSATTDVPVIPPEYDPYLVHKTIAECMQMLGDPRWEYHEAIAASVLKDAWNDNEDQLNYIYTQRDFAGENAPGNQPGQLYPYIRV